MSEWEDVEIGPEEIGEYWNPEKEGDWVEGNICSFTKDKWKNTRIMLDLGDDENGEMKTTELPSHYHLRRFNKNLKVGDYIRVELIEIVPPKKEDGNPTYKYKVQRNPDKFQEYE